MNCIIINTDGKTEEQVCEEAIRRIQENPAFTSLHPQNNFTM